MDNNKNSSILLSRDIYQFHLDSIFYSEVEMHLAVKVYSLLGMFIFTTKIPQLNICTFMYTYTKTQTERFFDLVFYLESAIYKREYTICVLLGLTYFTELMVSDLEYFLAKGWILRFLMAE